MEQPEFEFTAIHCRACGAHGHGSGDMLLAMMLMGCPCCGGELVHSDDQALIQNWRPQTERTFDMGRGREN